MTPRERVLKSLSHQQTDILPYQLDLTDEVHARMAGYLGDDEFHEKTGSHLAQERNESFTVVSPKEFRDMFGVLWPNDIPIENILAFLDVLQNQ